MPEYTLSPSYAFEKNGLFLQAEITLLQQAFDGKDSGNGIQSTADFKKSTSGFPQNSRSFLHECIRLPEITSSYCGEC